MEANICGHVKDEDTDQNFTCIVVFMHFIDFFFFFFVCSFISLPRKTDMERYGSQFHQVIVSLFANIVEQMLNL